MGELLVNKLNKKLNGIGNGVVLKGDMLGIVDDDEFVIQKCIESLNLFVTTTNPSALPVVMLHRATTTDGFDKEVGMVCKATKCKIAHDVILRILNDVCKDYGHVL